MKPVICALSIAILLLNACAKPQMAARIGHHEQAMGCAQLLLERQKAEQLLAASRADDRAKPQYILIFPALYSWYKMEKAENAAEDRIAALQQLYKGKGCDNPHYRSMQQRGSYGTPPQAPRPGYYGTAPSYAPSPQAYPPRRPAAPAYPPQRNPYAAPQGYARPPASPYAPPGQQPISPPGSTNW